MKAMLLHRSLLPPAWDGARQSLQRLPSTTKWWMALDSLCKGVLRSWGAPARWWPWSTTTIACAVRWGGGLTPHETLSIIFAQHKARFDSVVLGAFIRMMGVYPPGSIVQLVNDRYAIVASVNSSRPLRPRVIVHDSRIPKDEAPILDLESVPELGIRRSLKPSQLPRDALDYLSPRKRICYFFERAVNSDAPDSEAQAS